MYNTSLFSIFNQTLHIKKIKKLKDLENFDISILEITNTDTRMSVTVASKQTKEQKESGSATKSANGR